jgi:FkbM family methyltransferase
MSFVSYAQNLEDVMLWRALRHHERGFYIDIGAYDPTEHSVTKAFYDRGWSGINVEPVRKFYDKFQIHRPRDKNVNAAIVDRAGIIIFHEIADTGLSTAVDSVAACHSEVGFESRSVELPAITLADLCRDLVDEVHFLKIDVEGAEQSVLRGADFDSCRPWMIVIEAVHPLSKEQVFVEWESLIVDKGYDFAYWDGLNRFYVAREHCELRDSFSRPPNLSDDYVTYRQVLSDERIALLEADKLALEQERAVLVQERDTTSLENKAEVAGLKAEVARLKSKVAELEARQKALWESTSWRMTALLRKLKTASIVVRKNPGLLRPLVAKNVASALNRNRTTLSADADRFGRDGASSSWRLAKPVRNAVRLARLLKPGG